MSLFYAWITARTTATALDSIISQTLGAPGPTQAAALLALAVGIAGILLAALRAQYLGAARRRLARGKVEWDTLAAITRPQGFRRLMSYLERSRSVTGSEPQEVWRAAVDQLMAREELWESFLRALISVAVLLGLLGTVLGFMSLAPALTRHALDQLDAKLGGVFIGTGAGILSALLIYLIGLPWLRGATAKWSACVEEVGRIALVPLLPRPPTKIQDLVLNELTRRLDAVAEAWVSTLAEPAQALRDEVGAAATSVQQISDALRAVEITSGDLKALAASAAAMGTAAKSMAGSSTKFAGGSQQLAAVADSFREQLVSLSASIDEDRAQTSTLEDALRRGSQEVARRGEDLRNAVDEMSARFERLTLVVQSRMQEEAKVSQDAIEAVQRLNNLAQLSGEAARALRENVHETNLALSALSTSTNDTLRRIAESLGATLTQWTLDQQDLLQPLAGQLRGAAGGLSQASDQLRAGSEEIANMARQLTREGGRELQAALQAADEVLERARAVGQERPWTRPAPTGQSAESVRMEPDTAVRRDGEPSAPRRTELPDPSSMSSLPAATDSPSASGAGQTRAEETGGEPELPAESVPADGHGRASIATRTASDASEPSLTPSWDGKAARPAYRDEARNNPAPSEATIERDHARPSVDEAAPGTSQGFFRRLFRRQ